MTNRYLEKLACMAFSDPMVGESVHDSLKAKWAKSSYSGVTPEDLIKLCKTVCKKYEFNIENGHTPIVK